MRTTVSALIVFLSIVIVQPRATAQAPHAASQSAIDAALQEHAASTQADREAVLRVLQHSEVARLASQIGLDTTSASPDTDSGVPRRTGRWNTCSASSGTPSSTVEPPVTTTPEPRMSS